MRKTAKFFVLLWSFVPGLILAQTIEIETKERYIASANYQQGEEDQKNILILHGFLQTNNFSTVKRLADTLHETDLTVLSPTLSLGIHRRRESLPCEAIHTHSIQTDTDEIKQWVEWLYQSNGKKVTLIGHSAGSITLLNYVEQYGTEFIDQVILISMAPFTDNIGPVGQEQIEQRQLFIKQAQDDLNRGHDSLFNFQLSFCEIYPTISSAYLSYIQWNQEKLSALTTKYSNITNVIIGTDDERLSDEWRKNLISKGVNIEFVEGADHFFDQAYEFDLSDLIENLLDSTK